MEGREGRRKKGKTYTSAIRPIALIAHRTLPDYFAVGVGLVVVVDVAGAWR